MGPGAPQHLIAQALLKVMVTGGCDGVNGSVRQMTKVLFTTTFNKNRLLVILLAKKPWSSQAKFALSLANFLSFALLREAQCNLQQKSLILNLWQLFQKGVCQKLKMLASYMNLWFNSVWALLLLLKNSDQITGRTKGIDRDIQKTLFLANIRQGLG